MKRFTIYLLTCTLAFSLVACGSNEGNEKSKTKSDSVSESIQPTEDTDTNKADKLSNSESKILIAYFAVAENSDVDAVSSASVAKVNGEAKGLVRILAEDIQSETGWDLFSIQTSVDYPGNGKDLIDYAAEEQEDNVRPELTTSIENLDEYDTIFIGFPNWWYDMPMVMYSFFEEYDFSGKTIIPFNSHNGSRFSSTIDTIQELEPKATVIKDGFTVNEKDVTDAYEDIVDWLKDLGY